LSLCIYADRHPRQSMVSRSSANAARLRAVAPIA